MLREVRIVALALCFSFASLYAAEIEQTDVQLAKVNEAISAIEDWINDARNNRSQLENDLRAASRELETTQEQLTANQARILLQRNELDALQTQQDALLASKAEQLAMVAQAMRASHRLGQDSGLKLLLNQQDPGPTSRMLHYYAVFNESRLTRIAEFQHTIDQLDVTSAAIVQTTEDLQLSNQTLQEQLALLETTRLARAQILQDLEAELALRSGELEQLQQDRQHLENLIDEINRIVVDIPEPQDLMPFAQARGQMPWPLEGARLNRFGANYSEGNLQRQGIIINAAVGTPVRAIHPGRVVFSDWLRGSGLLVVLDHGNGYLSLYAQNEGLTKQVGDWANRGEAIATAGTNAGMDAPGIYFEIRHNGQPIDPVIWCRSSP